MMNKCSRCIHKCHLINQGIEWCDKNYDIGYYGLLDCQCTGFEERPDSETFSYITDEQASKEIFKKEL